VALIGWLKAQKLPPRIDSAPTEKKPAAWVEPSFGSGSVVLQRGDRLLRVVWPLGARDQRRVLPPGKYRLRELRIERKKGEAIWFVSSSGPPYQPLQVSAKGLTKLTIDDGLVCKLNVKPKGEKLTIGFKMRAERGHNITLFKNGKRVVLTYRVLDAKGKQLAQGTMNYG